MKLLLIFAVVLLSGCATTYSYTSGDKTLMIKTYREFPGGLKAEYGDFKVEAGEVRNSNDTEAISALILGILPLLKPTPGG